ncbi:HSP20-like chaperone [Lactifluus volemus]|nr:HSP20-like chaperone [Lactifluus volemus]
MSLTHHFNEYAFPLDRFLDDMFSSRTSRQGQQSDVFRPRMDVRHDEQSNKVIASVELPGIKKEDVSIGGVFLRERRYGKFSRSLSLPQGVKNNDIKANMTDGILHVTFPRTAPESAPARITIE